MSKYKMPEYYDFPPFFTLQPVLETQSRQIKLWRKLITEYFNSINKTTIYTKEDINHTPFHNTKINRKLSTETLVFILNQLKESGHGFWEDKDHTIFKISWKTFEEWANLIYKWATENKKFDEIFTIYELHSGNVAGRSEFTKLDNSLLLKALKVLVKEKKLVMYKNENVDEIGVKFVKIKK